jgi:hypothetical protein
MESTTAAQQQQQHNNNSSTTTRAAAAMAFWSDIIGVVVAFAGLGFFSLLRKLIMYNWPESTLGKLCVGPRQSKLNLETILPGFSSYAARWKPKKAGLSPCGLLTRHLGHILPSFSS